MILSLSSSDVTFIVVLQHSWAICNAFILYDLVVDFCQRPQVSHDLLIKDMNNCRTWHILQIDHMLPYICVVLNILG